MIRKSNLIASFAVAAMVFAVGATGVGATTLAQSNFDSGTEGWTIFADGVNLTHHASGGNSGGYISITDAWLGPTFGFVAPGAFLGNQSSAYGGNLHFDLNQEGAGVQVDVEDVTLSGAGFTLVFDAGDNPAFSPNWSSYDVSLLASAGWKIGNLAGPAATEGQLQQVLGNLEVLRIRGEFQGAYADTGSLDSVSLDSGPSRAPSNVPEPSSLTLMGAGISLALWMVRRRSSTKTW
jgi:hypothetical protein